MKNMILVSALVLSLTHSWSAQAKGSKAPSRPSPTEKTKPSPDKTYPKREAILPESIDLKSYDYTYVMNGSIRADLGAEPRAGYDWVQTTFQWDLFSLHLQYEHLQDDSYLAHRDIVARLRPYSREMPMHIKFDRHTLDGREIMMEILLVNPILSHFVTNPRDYIRYQFKVSFEDCGSELSQNNPRSYTGKFIEFVDGLEELRTEEFLKCHISTQFVRSSDTIEESGMTLADNKLEEIGKSSSWGHVQPQMILYPDGNLLFEVSSKRVLIAPKVLPKDVSLKAVKESTREFVELVSSYGREILVLAQQNLSDAEISLVLESKLKAQREEMVAILRKLGFVYSSLPLIEKINIATNVHRAYIELKRLEASVIRYGRSDFSLNMDSHIRIFE